MEKIKSTDTLEVEILEDARKKAEKALKTAEQAAQAVATTWEKKLVQDVALLEQRHEDRIQEKEDELKARLPLDKRRFRAERYENLLRSSMVKTLEALPRAKQLQLLEQQLMLRAPEIPPAALAVTRSGLTQKETENILAALKPAPVFTCVPASPEAENQRLPALVIASGRVTIHISIASLGEQLLADHRAELASALLGKEALND